MKELLKELLDTNFVSYIEPGIVFEVVEKNSSGAGVCKFKSLQPVVLIKGKDKDNQLVWAIKNKKCAEAAFFKLEEKSLSLVEMKGKLTLKTFETVREQFAGMYLCAQAILRILQLDEPVTIRAYLVYKEDNISNGNPQSQDYIENKALVGQKNPLRDAWDRAEISLPHRRTAVLIKAVRNQEGNYDFGVV